LYEEAISIYSVRLRQILNKPIYRFDEATSVQVPSVSGVYLIYEGESKIIYAGRSKNLRTRLLQQHKRGNVGGSQFRKALGQKQSLASEVKISGYIETHCSFQFLPVEGFEEMVRLEHFITAILAPTLNIELKQ
jgi:excinuclease UvrABC nuclease subunit